MTEQGIDVAWPQGARYNWAGQKGRISFGMCKATEGVTLVDPDLKPNWDGMWELSPTLPRFAYHFFRAADDPVIQAEHFVSAVKAHGLLAGDNLVLDLESNQENGSNDDVASSTVAARAKIFLNHVNRSAPDHRVLVYTNPAFAETGACAGLDPWFLWLASYGVSKPKVPAPWRDWTFWQTGDSPVDQDRFNGTDAELLSFCRMPESR